MFKNLIENFPGDFSEAHVNPESMILSGVVIASTRQSANGYEYSTEAFDSLTRFATGSKVFINHDSKSERFDRDGVRNLRDWMGTIHSASRNGDVVKGNFHVRKEFWELVSDIASMSPKDVGFSINASCKVYIDSKGKESVVDIANLKSCDLVASTSLTKSLFESNKGGLTDEELTTNEILESIKGGTESRSTFAERQEILESIRED